MNQRRAILSITILVLLFGAVYYYQKANKAKEVPNGGFCSYAYKYYPARILSLDKFSLDSSSMDITFEVNFGSQLDTLNYTETNGAHYNIKTNNFKPDTGMVVRYVHKYITEGSCSPTFFYFELSPY